MIYLATDHAGFELKEKIKSWLTEWEIDYEDFGAFSMDPEDDYPDYVSLAAEAISKDPESKAIILGGSGQAEAIVANRHRGVRAIVYYGSANHSQIDADGSSLDMITSTREHNNANVLSLGARFISEEDAKAAIKLWLDAPFSGAERHVRRLKKIDQ